MNALDWILLAILLLLGLRLDFVGAFFAHGAAEALGAEFSAAVGALLHVFVAMHQAA